MGRTAHAGLWSAIADKGGLRKMGLWQEAVIAAVAVASLGWMSSAIVRLFTRRATTSAVEREGTDAESALVGASVPAGARLFDGWAYRVGARFAGRVRVAIYPHTVSVCGPRVSRRLYQVWIWTQGLILACVLPALAAAVVTLDWRWLVVGVGSAVVSFAVSIVGAGLWPGLGELAASGTGGRLRALEFPRSAVNQVSIGKGWSDGGLGVVLFPYKAGIDAMSAARAVSFFAPDELGREVRYAIDLYDAERASAAAELLSAQESGAEAG